MRIDWKAVAFGLVVLVAIAKVPGCVNVQGDDLGEPALQPLGGDNGYVLLHHPDGKFYIVQLETGSVREVSELPALPQ